MSLLAELYFGSQGNAVAHTGPGWSFPEDGFTWSIGASSRFFLHTPQASTPAILELSLHAFCLPPVLTAQRLSIAVNGHVVGQTELRGPVTLGFLVPAHLCGSGLLDVRLNHPDARSPASCGLAGDERVLGVAMRSVRLWQACWADGKGGGPDLSVGPEALPGAPARVSPAHAPARVSPAHAPPRDAAALVSCFESLGHNCEFGFMQRAVGAEPLGLLRFAGLHYAALLDGVACGFAGLGDPEDLSVHTGRVAGREEYLVRSARHAATFHSACFADQTDDLAFVVARTSRYLRFLQRAFCDSLQGGFRIFVVHDPALQRACDALPLLARLQAHGPNRLLYVTAAGQEATGTVRREAGGLLHGFIDRLTPMDAAQPISVDGWLRVCAEAMRLAAGQASSGDADQNSVTSGAAARG